MHRLPFRTRLVATLASLILLAAAGCEGGEDPCSADGDCASGEHCALGRCVAQCEADSDCAALGPGATCDVDLGRCEPPEVEPGELCVSHMDCADTTYCNGAELCAPGDDAADERGCVAAADPCGEGEMCLEAARRCVPSECEEADADGDGHLSVACGGDDCDDADVNRFAGNPEVCDAEGHDEDCDASTFGFADMDRDGYIDAACCNDDGQGGQNCGDDCADLRSITHPNHVEVCDGFDNDCDALVDEGVVPTWYADADGDGFGDADASLEACIAPPGHVDLGADCDDADRAVNPSARELCNGVDDNCDGLTDAEDATVETCECLEGETIECGVSVMGECRMGTRRCAADGFYGPCNGNIDPRPEGCNALDDDCDGETDEGVITRCYRDDDEDGHGTPDDEVETCGSCPDGYVEDDRDCNDARADTYAGAFELCDRRDNDCGSGGGVDPSEDLDEDGHASPSAACFGGLPKDDCRDDLPAVHGGPVAYADAPVCPEGQAWCFEDDCCAQNFCGGMVIGCAVAQRGTWDLNCSGQLEVRPQSSGACELRGSPVPTCQGSGPVASAASCGDEVMYRVCEGGFGSPCTESFEMRRPGCR